MTVSSLVTELSSPEARGRDAESILLAAIAAAEPAQPVQRALESAPELATAHAVRVIAIGKAAIAMAGAAMRVSRRLAVGGVVVAPRGAAAPVESLDALEILYAAHPAPDASSVNAALAIDTLLQESGADDVIVILVSGGASALVTLPVNGITIDEYAACTIALMKAGADIVELNTVRKHLDRLKGGGMAARSAPARVLCLVLSDVAGDALDVIASGPLSPDPTTRADAERVLRARGIWDGCAESIRSALRDATETPKPGDPVFDRVRVAVVASNGIALDGAARRAVQLGYDVRRVAGPVLGEARLAGERLAHEAKRIRDTLAAGHRPVCLLAGGETTVKVRGAGRGGRNQELVLGALLELGPDVTSATASGAPDPVSARTITVGSIGTDGIDGPTDAAGAVAGAGALARAAELGIDPRAALDHNDSHGFFDRVGGLLRTGSTGTNVMDVQVFLIG